MNHSWLSDLRSYGVLVSRPVLEGRFPAGVPAVETRREEALREAYRALEAGSSSLEDWVREVARLLMGIENRPLVVFGEDVERYISLAEGQRALELPYGLILSPQGTSLVPRLGIWFVKKESGGRWGRTCANAQRFLREAHDRNFSLGLVTDGELLRLYHGGVEGESWVEWNATRWFDEAARGDEMAAFALILGKDMLGIGREECPLEELVKESRKKQGDLSSRLGERLRIAVEEMINKVVNSAIERCRSRGNDMDPITMIRTNTDGTTISEELALQALYQAAIRVVMRLVFVSYAESRELLPIGERNYLAGYSLQQLYEQLKKNRDTFGEGYLQGQLWAWPRLLALFDLVVNGSRHDDLRLPTYGGELFTRGDQTSPVRKALTLFEDPMAMSDFDVFHLLELVRRSGVSKNGQIAAGGDAVDFSDLRTEYIGIMYEGFLDYFPRLVHNEDGAYVELNGKGFHAYPLSRLESMNDAQLRDFIKKVREGSKDKGLDEEEEGEDGSEDEDLEEEANASPEVAEPTIASGEYSPRTREWAKRAAKACRIVGKKCTPADEEKAIKALVRAEHQPGKVFLISWAGVRKGSGTYYTRPGLVIPLVQRTLEPMVHRSLDTREPKSPQEILELKVVDPSMGSGSFLVATSNFMAEALYRSWKYHGLIDRLAKGEQLLLPDGRASIGLEEEDVVAHTPNEDGFDEYLLNRLRRHVIERCIYGVDINPLAVELAKLSLWIETLDPGLPFEFLDHKLKVGNSLVGTWLFEAFEYPIAAWGRWENVAKSKDPLKQVLAEPYAWIKDGEFACKEELKGIVSGLETRPLFGANISQLTEVLRNKFDSIHSAAEGDRPRRYREFMDSQEYIELKAYLDRWCAIWFWPPTHGNSANGIPTPSWFYRTPAGAKDKLNYEAEEISRAQRFFHWQLEFPDVFGRIDPGFDAVIGNPPWNKVKQESVPFFTRYDPLFPTYIKQTEIKEEKQLFEQHPHIVKEWQESYLSNKNLSHFSRSVQAPFNTNIGQSNDPWKRHIRKSTNGVRVWGTEEDTNIFRPFSLQGGGDGNLYKLFTEQSMFLVRRSGRIGMVLPGAIFSDHGAIKLRKTILDSYGWEWLFSFENRRGIFPIGSMVVFCCVVFQAGKPSDQMKTAFIVHEMEDWSKSDFKGVLMNRDLISRFSPWAIIPPAINDQKDLNIMDVIYKQSTLIGDSKRNPKIRYCREYDITTDSGLFPARSIWEGKGFIRDPFGFWVSREGKVGLPLIEGKMIWVYDPFFSEHISGGNWRYVPWHRKVPQPRCIMDRDFYYPNTKSLRGAKVSFRSISRSTNERTMISAVVPDFPRGNSAFGFSIETKLNIPDFPSLCGINSLLFDYIYRLRKVGMNNNKFLTDELPLVDTTSSFPSLISTMYSLHCSLTIYAPEWLLLNRKYGEGREWSENWSWSEPVRMRHKIVLDAIQLFSSGLEHNEIDHLLSLNESKNIGFFRTDIDLKGSYSHLRYAGLVRDAICQLVSDYGGNTGLFIKNYKVPSESIEVRDEVRGIGWRGFEPTDRLTRDADYEAYKNGNAEWAIFAGNSKPKFQSSPPDVPRYAIHVHRDLLSSFLVKIERGEFKRDIIAPYETLWKAVWESDPEKTVLTWDDCDEYARCVLSFVRPEGAYDRLQEVLVGKKPYRYIYDPEYEAKLAPEEGKQKERPSSMKTATLESYLK